MYSLQLIEFWEHTKLKVAVQWLPCVYYRFFQTIHIFGKYMVVWFSMIVEYTAAVSPKRVCGRMSQMFTSSMRSLGLLRKVQWIVNKC